MWGSENEALGYSVDGLWSRRRGFSPVSANRSLNPGLSHSALLLRAVLSDCSGLGACCNQLETPGVLCFFFFVIFH